ncbi:MAG: M28 family peptidase [Bacteroidales bacterium]
MAKTKQEQITRLKSILSIPTYFKQEHQLLRHLLKFLVTTPYEFDVDNVGNIYITKGKADFYPCVCAHLDSVQRTKSFSIHEVTYKDKSRLIGKDDEGYQCGIGADDKAGVFVCMELLDEMPVLKVAMFTGEEFGCIGSQNARPEFFTDVGYVIEFDCPGNADVTHYCNGIKLFDETADFYQKVHPILVERMGKEPTLWKHPYTDVWPLKRMFDFSCINIATGYYQYHTMQEYIVVDELLNAIAMGAEIINELGCEKYEFKPPLTEINTYEYTIERMKKQYPEIFKSENSYTALKQEVAEMTTINNH